MPTNVVVTPGLEFKDGSTYSGQARPGTTLIPHGYGHMRNQGGFEMTGYFLDGKAHKLTIVDPERNLFLGQWIRNQEQSQRHGRCLAIKPDGDKQLIEEYEHGKLLKRTRRREVDGKKDHWLPPTVRFGGLPPSARTEHSCSVVMDGSMLLVFGGVSQHERLVLNDLHVADLTSQTWMGTPEMEGEKPPPLYGHTATVIPGDRVVFIGGHLSPLEVSSSVYVLDSVNGVWSKTVSKGINLAEHRAVLVDERTIVVIVQDSVFTLDVIDWIWTQREVDARALGFQKAFVDFSACFHEGLVYCYGGEALNQASSGINQEGKVYRKMSNSMRVLDIDSWTWSLASTTGPEQKQSSSSSTDNYTGIDMAKGGWNCPRSQHTAVVVDNRMIVCGGYTTRSPKMNEVDDAFLSDVQILDLQTGAFLPPSSLVTKYDFNVPRGRHTCVHYDGRLLVLGGQNHAFPGMLEERIFVLGKTGEKQEEEGREKNM